MLSTVAEYILLGSSCRFPYTLYQYEIIHKSTTSMEEKSETNEEEEKKNISLKTHV